MTAELAVKAVKNACLNVANPEGIIIQSDLGTQYTSDIFERYLAAKKIRHSFSQKGCLTIMHALNLFIQYLKKKKSIVRFIKIQKGLMTASLNILNPGTITGENIVA